MREKKDPPKKNYVKPNWIRVKLPTGENYRKIRRLVDQYNLHTICQSGICPNIGECWGRGVATFMILGNICTRSCRFCGVKTGLPENIDWEEPKKIALSIKLMHIKHAVITSVNRDDLKDMGSFIWVDTIRKIRIFNPSTTLETLIPDFKGNTFFLDKILRERPEVVSHNMETISRLSREVRIQAKFYRSLEVLRYLKRMGQPRIKSGIMLGLGETEIEVLELMEVLKSSGVDIITIGQYLQPTKKHLPVKEFITPKQFKKYEEIGLKMGFRHVESGALVRSSYHAYKHIH
ncbi:MAG: lipoyl synthase [Candidatus Walczuchella monophlebidarum]